MIVKRLRAKLDAVDESRGRSLIKTEFRRGYILAADVVPAAAALGEERRERARK